MLHCVKNDHTEGPTRWKSNAGERVLDSLLYAGFPSERRSNTAGSASQSAGEH